MKRLMFAAIVLGASFIVRGQETSKSRFVFRDEWDRHAGTIVIFPPTHAYPKLARALQAEVAALADAIRRHEPVHLFVYDRDVERAKNLLKEKVTVHSGSAYSIDWARDTAPLITRDAKGRRRAMCFRFNGWGKKFVGWQHDVGVGLAIAKALKLPITRSEFVLEGGAIEIGDTSRGRTAVMTERCVLNRNRNDRKDWPRAKIERELKEKLGLDRIIWVAKGLAPDPITDGHIDGLVKFVKHDTVLVHTTSDKHDVNFKICRDAKKRLQAAGLKVIDLPLAEDVVHLNFYIGSGGDVAYVPICGDPKQDDPALVVIRRLFKTVVPLRATAMARAGGGIHCQTQQIPAKTAPAKPTSRRSHKSQ